MVRTAENRRELRNRLEAPEKCVGYKVFDPEGHKIGRVKKLFTNVHGEPQYVRVRIGFFGLKSVLIPVKFAVIDQERWILTLR